MQQPPEKLTWDDLILSEITESEASRWLSDWQWLVEGRLSPIFVTRFGNWFFRRPDDTVEMLDVCEATISLSAPDFQTFQGMVNSQEWQEEFLYSALLLQYRRRGIIASGREAIAFAPHPAMVPSLDSCEVMVVDMVVWQSICGQTMRQLGRNSQ